VNEFLSKFDIYLLMIINLMSCFLCDQIYPQTKLINRLDSTYLHIPGPNPILKPGSDGEWDDQIIECSEILKDANIYFLYYHAADGSNYRIGVATASNPLGPWKKFENNPIIDIGTSGSWEDNHVACASIIKKDSNNYLMWYSGMKQGEYPKWGIGLAYATSPLGPWVKYSNNPVIADFGYLGSVIANNNKYLMYSCYPVNSTSYDSGPISVAMALHPEGNWVKYVNNPILLAGSNGSWDDGGYSESSVFIRDGIFQSFFGGQKIIQNKIEHVGYAYSDDGFNFIKHNNNPIILLKENPGASAFSEVHTLWEYPFYYCKA